MEVSDSPSSFPDWAGSAHAYATGVVAGTVPAGEWVRLAAARHLADLRRADDPRYPYHFHAPTGAFVCQFIEFLPHTKGKWAQGAQLIHLEPWQCFLVVVGFGWLKKSNNKRRFSYFYWEIPRKNGKSLLAGGIGNYMAWADGEYGAEVYSGATKEVQAWEVFGPARLMMKNTPEFADHMSVSVRAKTMIRFRDGSKFHPVVGDPGDGASPSCAIIDEFHEHDTPKLHDTMETGMGAREQPIMLVITTAGENIAGPCHEKHDQVKRILQGLSEGGDEVFACIFGIDDGDDWADPKSLVKANPNYGISIEPDWLRVQQRNAMASPAQQAKFKTKHLNIWANVYNGLFNMHDWKKCEDKQLLEDILIEQGAECVFGVDLASKLDLCANVRIYKRDVEDRPHIYAFARFWLPEAAITEEGPNKASYGKWVLQGHLIQTSGATVDFGLITDEVRADCKQSNPREVVYDPFNATQFAQGLQEDDIECVEFVQNPQNFAVPIDELQSLMKDGRFHHDGNPILSWCMANVVGRPAKKGLYSPIKQKPHQKIDGAIALIIGLSRLVEPAEDNGMGDFTKNMIVV